MRHIFLYFPMSITMAVETVWLHSLPYTWRGGLLGSVCWTLCFPMPCGCCSSSGCSDRSAVCGILQHQQPDRGQTVDLWCQGAEMTCFCHWVCAPSREALNYIGTALTDMFVIQSLLRIPRKEYYCFDKHLNSLYVCVWLCVGVLYFQWVCLSCPQPILLFYVRFCLKWNETINLKKQKNNNN